jgi:hypothetical protein
MVATDTSINPDAELFDLEAFHKNGFLWAINRYVLHPRGLAMAVFYPDGEKTPTGWQVYRSEDGLWQFGEELDHVGHDRFEAFLSYIEMRNNG